MALSINVVIFKGEDGGGVNGCMRICIDIHTYVRIRRYV